MKNYVVSDYENFNDLYADLTAELNELVKTPIEIEHVKYGKGVIMNLKVSVAQGPQVQNELVVVADIEFYFDNPCRLAINRAMDTNMLIVPEPEKSIIMDFIAEASKLQLEVKELEHQRFVADWEAKKQAEEAARQKAKLQAKMEKDIQDFKAMAKEARPRSASGEFYYALGWLAKNAGAISATLPDYLLPYFEGQFGTAYTPTVVDSTKRTTNGHSMQWTFSMKVALPKKAQESVPAAFFNYLSSNKAALANTSFVWSLVANYGFQFGKTQDVDKIRESIPTEYLEYFERGYAE